MGIVRIALAGVLGTLLAVQFKNGKSEYGIYVSIVLSIFIFMHILGKMEMIVEVFLRVGNQIKIKSVYILALLKMIGVAYIAQFASSVCKDAGFQTIAQQIDIFAKLTILVLSMPVLVTLLETIECFLS